MKENRSRKIDSSNMAMANITVEALLTPINSIGSDHQESTNLWTTSHLAMSWMDRSKPITYCSFN